MIRHAAHETTDPDTGSPIHHPATPDPRSGGHSASRDTSRSAANAQRSRATMGDAINEDTRPRAPVVRALANPALTSKTSLSSPAPIHRRNSLVDPERRALAVPKPRARSRMPTVRIING